MKVDLRITFSEQDIEALCRERLSRIRQPEEVSFSDDYWKREVKATFAPIVFDEASILDFCLDKLSDYPVQSKSHFMVRFNSGITREVIADLVLDEDPLPIVEPEPVDVGGEVRAADPRPPAQPVASEGL